MHSFICSFACVLRVCIPFTYGLPSLASTCKLSTDGDVAVAADDACDGNGVGVGIGAGVGIAGAGGAGRNTTLSSSSMGWAGMSVTAAIRSSIEAITESLCFRSGASMKDAHASFWRPPSPSCFRMNSSSFCSERGLSAFSIINSSFGAAEFNESQHRTRGSMVETRERHDILVQADVFEILVPVCLSVVATLLD